MELGISKQTGRQAGGVPQSAMDVADFSNSQTKDNTSTVTSSSSTAAQGVTLGLKHVAVDVGSLGSVAVRRTNTHSLVAWKTVQLEEGPSTTELSASKSSREKPESSTKKGAPGREPGPCFWGCFSAILIFVFVGLGQFDPIHGKNISWTYSMYFRREPSQNCRGRRVYMYNLPQEFNTVVHNETRCKYSLIKWMDLCPRFGNRGYGIRLWNKSTSQSGDHDFDYLHWFDTDGYMLEMIFHNRMQTYRCLTTDASQANALFIPYYTGLHALDYLYEMEDLTPTYEKRKHFGKELIDWLENNGGEAWRRYGGSDHFLIMGRTSWDFKLQKMWGTGFSALPYVANMTTLTLERDTREANEQAIPYPTAFHPASPERLGNWIKRVQTANRKYLFSYIGGPRSDSWTVRGIISSSCAKAGPSVCNLVNCSVVRCSHDPVFIYKHFLRSVFCLQPRGDSSTRRSTFDCLISGAIPVFFHVDSAYTQYSWHLPAQPESYSVYIDQEDVRKGVSIQDILLSYSQERIDEMRRTIVAVIPNLLYNDYANDPWSPTSQKDAFEVSIERVLEKIAAAKEEHQRSV